MSVHDATTTPPTSPPLVETRCLYQVFARHSIGGQRKFIHAVNGVDLSIGHGEVVGLVGESGCGKSTYSKMVLRLLAPTSGSVLFKGDDITRVSGRALMPFRREVQAVFQDPFASLNSLMTVEDILTEPLRTHRKTAPGAWPARVRRLLSLVGLSQDSLHRKPGEFSGGQQQRIAIARALASEPSLVVADEALSALDASIQAQVLNLFVEVQQELGVSYLFISHNLTVVRHISHRVGVMYRGRLMELAPSEDLYRSPLHPYTQALLSAVPVPDPEEERRRRRRRLQGDPPNPALPLVGCPFQSRCWMSVDECKTEMPDLLPVPGHPDHLVACHLVDREPPRRSPENHSGNIS